MNNKIMKTIFITAFEGVEIKNILRTGIADGFYNNGKNRVVVLVKNDERASYCKANFSEDKMTFVSISLKKSGSLDRVFSRLKFALLETKTTALKRKMAFEVRRGYVRYILAGISHAIFARPLVRKIVRYLDYAFVRDDSYKSLFDEYQPDIIFTAHLFDERESHLVREARRRNIPSLGFINSWDKVTSRAMIRVLPTHFLVFNKIVKGELVKHNEVNEADITVVGLPQYDAYVQAPPPNKDDFFRKTLIPTEDRVILYTPMGTTFSGNDWEVIDMLERLRKDGKFGDKVSVLVRFQPNDFVDEKELAKRPWLRYDYPGVRFVKKRGVDWDMSDDDLNHLKNSLSSISVLVGYASSMVIDSAFFDKPVINIKFVVGDQKKGFVSPLQYYGTDHYKNVLDTNAVEMVGSEDELVKKVQQYLQSPDIKKSERSLLVKSQCEFIDGKSSERIVKKTLSFLKK